MVGAHTFSPIRRLSNNVNFYLLERTLITHFINPEGGSMAHLDCGALLQMGPTWGRQSEEWVLTFGFPMNDTKRFETDALPARIRQLLKLPDLEMEVMHVNHWVLDRVVADKYRVGRVFIAGDAAHRRPPASGLGLNTGIEDAKNIAWKLAFVLDHKADPSLLDTYQSERRPIGIRNSDWAFFSFSNMNVLSAGVGAIPGAKEFNDQRFAQLFEDSERGRSALHHLRRVLQTQNVEYSAHDIELGFSYSNGVLVSDGTTAPVPDPEGQIYKPTTRPGHRLPHAWLVQEGMAVSTHDLVRPAGADFVLLTDEGGDKWVKAAEKLTKETNVKVSTAQIRADDLTKPKGLYLDHQDSWAQLKEVATGGAVLVRPDNFVAWRSTRPSEHPEEELANVLANLMRQNLHQISQPSPIEASTAEVKIATARPDIAEDGINDDSSTTASSSIATPVNELDEPQGEDSITGTSGEKDTSNLVRVVINELQDPASEM